MPEQIYIGKFSKGQKTDATAFNIDNDAFPWMYNFYSWRGRAKKKRGTVFLGQLQRQIKLSNPVTTNWEKSLSLAADSANLINNGSYTLESTSTIAPGTISLTVGANTYTEPATPDGTLTGTPAGSGTINYVTGAITISGGGVSPITGTYGYFPGLPAMGLQDFDSTNNQFPVLLAFDTKYSYQLKQTSTIVNFYNTSYYKSTNTPFTWSGEDYQLFFTENYQGALWATNNKPGFHFVTATYSAGSPGTAITFNFQSSAVNYTSLIVGDKVWFNEWTGGSTINGLTGTVTDATGAAAGNYIVTFETAQTVAGTGIAQLLTASISGQDGIKWYDGDMTSSTGLPTSTSKGWVNFSPPVTNGSFSINSTTPAQYYLVGALAIAAFKDRLVFFSPYIQSVGNTPIQLMDVALWSWDGTPFYTPLSTTSFYAPSGKTADASAYYVNQTGKGGYLSAGTNEPISTIATNEDVLMVGFGGRGRKTRFVSSGDDLQPFLFFNINSELPSSSTFSAVTLDRGAIDIGVYGIAMTDQQSSQRIDLDIPDNVFQIQTLNNGFLRVNAIRDFKNEWIFFSYPVNTSRWKFPTQTFLYNYRDNTWGVLYENFTVHGNFRKQQKYTWKTIPFANWAQWKEKWNAGSTSALVPQIIGGTPQGYVLIKSEGTGEGKSGTVYSISNAGGNTKVTSYNHCVTENDYIYFSGALGLTGWNGLIGKVTSVSQDSDNFTVDIPFPSGTYLGLGSFTRLCQPLLQTKMFNPYWDQGRKTRLGVQKYLLDRTTRGEITVQIYLSQNDNDPWNDGPIVPEDSPNNALIYSQTLFTRPENDIQNPIASTQNQIWHRFNDSLIGDSVQIGFTLSDSQMRDYDIATSDVVLHAMHFVLERGPHLA